MILLGATLPVSTHYRGTLAVEGVKRFKTFEAELKKDRKINTHILICKSRIESIHSCLTLRTL